MSKFLPIAKLIHSIITITFSSFASLHGQALIATIVTTPASSGGIVTGCEGVPIRFTSLPNDTGLTVIWSFSNGIPATANGLGPHDISFSASGWAIVTVSNSQQTSKDSVQVLVSPNITVAPTFVGTVVQNFEGVSFQTRCNQVTGNIQINNNIAGWAPGTSYAVNYGDGSPVVTPTPAANGAWSLVKNYPSGEYILTVTGTNGNCVKTFTQRIYVGSQPNVGFAINSSTSICVPDSIDFPITSVSNNSLGTRYIINVNDGSLPDTFFHPPPANYVHNFTVSSCGSTATSSNQGNTTIFQNSYQAVITASNPCGNATVSLQPIYVSNKNQTGFTVTPDSLICINNPVVLNDTTRYGLDVGATSCDSLPIRIWGVSPSTGWTLTTGSLGDAQGFTTGGPFGYDPSFWISGTPSVTLSFSQPGNYNLVLRTGNTCGEDSAVTQICIDPPITANFDVSDSLGCFPLVVSTTNLSTLGTCNREKYHWTVSFTDTIGCGNNDWAFINGTDSVSFQPTFQFNGPGIYDIQLETNPRLDPEDATRCPVDTAVKRVVVKDRPSVAISFTSPICQTDTVQFTETIANCYGTQSLQYLWTLTGALPGSDTTVNPGGVVYQSHGLFPISLLVTNECGADTAIDTIDVRQPVQVSVTPGTNACMDDPVPVNGTFGGSAIIATWSASVPGGSFAPNNSTQPGTYTPPTGFIGNINVLLITNDPPGPCPADTAVATYVFDQNGISQPGTYPDLCQNGTQALSGSVGGAATTGTWSAQPPGSFSPSTSDLNAVYTPPGGYIGPITLTLITNDPPGSCLADTATTTFVLNPTPVATPVATPTLCSGDTTQLALTSSTPGTVFNWVPVPNVNISGATADSGLVIQQGLVNISLADQVQQYTITPSLNGCPGLPINVSVNIRANTLMVPTLDTTACPGQNIGPINFTSNPPGASFNWVSGNSSVGISSGTGAIGAFPAPANAGPAAIVSNIIVTPTLNNCAGTPDTFVVTVNPTPDVSNSPLTDSLCSGSGSQAIVFTSNVANTSFTWSLSSNVGVASGALAAGTDSIPSQTLSTLGNTTGVLTYTVTPAANNCPGTPVNYEIYVLPIPDVVLPPAQSICPGAASTPVTFTSGVAGTTFSWTSAPVAGVAGNTASGTGNLPAETLTNTNPSQAVVTYIVTPQANGCSGTPVNYTISVEGSPDVSFSPGPQAICSGGNSTPITLSSTTPGVTFSWSMVVPPTFNFGGILSGTGNNIPSFSFINPGVNPDSAIITVIATPPNAPCPGSPFTYSIVVNPIPGMTITPSSATVCSGNGFTLVHSSASLGTTYAWTVATSGPVSGQAAGTGDTIAQTVFNLTGADQTVTYTTTPDFAGCLGSPVSAVVTVQFEPQMATVSDITVCSGGTVGAINFTSNPPGAVFTWQNDNAQTGLALSGNAAIPSFTANANNTASAAQSTVIVTPTTNGCAGQPDTFLLVVQPDPTVTNNPLAQSSCSGASTQAVVFTGNVAGSTFSWNLTSSNNLQPVALVTGMDSIPSQNLTTITIANGDATYTIVPSANGCIGNQVNYVYTIAPNPDVLLPVAQTICSGNSTAVVIPSSTLLGATFNWTAAATGGVTGFTASGVDSIPSVNPMNPSPTTQTITYTITPTANGCAGSPVNYVITVQPSVVVNLNPALQTFCNGGNSLPISATTTTPGAVLNWTAQAPVSLSGWSGSGIDDVPAYNLVNSGNQIDTLFLIYTPSFAGCNGVVDTALIVVFPTPNVVANPANQTICSGGGTNIAFSGNAQNTIFNWVPSVNPLVSGTTAASGNVLQDTLTQSGNTSTLVTYTVTPTVSNCPGAAIQVPVTILPVPVLTPQPDIQVCSTQPVAPINFVSTVAGTNVSWTNSNTGIGLPPTGNGDIPGYNAPLHNGPGVLSGQIIVQPSASGCFGISDTFNLVVDPQPLVTLNPANATICSNQITAIGISSILPGTTFSWVVNSGGLTGTNAGNGNLIAQTLVNPGITTLTALYIITPSLNGCFGPNDTATVSVIPAPQLNVVTGPTNFCSGGTTNIQLSSPVAGATFTWTLSGGASIVGALPGNGPTIIQTLTNSSNAIDSVTYHIVPAFNGCALAPTPVTIVVNPIPSAIATPDTSTICSGNTTGIQLISPVANTTFNWTESAPPSITGASPGNGQQIGQTLNNTTLISDQVVYNITYSANGCAGAPIQAVVNVNPVAPVAANPSNLTICSGQPFQIALSSSVNGATLSWTTSPNVNVGGATAGAGDTISQTLTTAVAGGEVVNYLVTATFQNCPGPLLVVPVTVNALPIINPGLPQTLCLNSPAANLQGFSPAGGSWSGTGITTPQPGTFVPSIAGVGAHPITYNYTDPLTNCSNSASINMVVNPLPTISYTHDTLVCVNAPINLVNTTVDASQYAWSFGNGTNSTMANPIQTYPAPGLYTISYTATTSLGCSAGANSTVRIISAPSASFNLLPPLGCAPLQVAFNNTTSAYAATYLWNLGNGTTSALETPTPSIYPGSLTADTLYSISLTATNQCGTSTFIDTLPVLSQPVSFFGTNVSVGCAPLTIQLSQNSFGGPTSYSWNFGNGTVSVASLPGPQTFTYNGSNDTTYYITLTVTNSCGSSTHVDSVRVLPNNINPFFNTNPTSGCAPLSINFTNFTAGATLYNWDFGDGNVSTQMSPSHTYLTGGAYNVMMAANNGCAFDTAYFLINVFPQPSVTFAVAQDSLCEGFNMQFINTSPNLSNLLWNFGDGNTSSLTNPTHAYGQGGTYNVSLIGTAQVTGCTDTAFASIFIKPGIDVAIALSDSVGCAPFLVQFLDVGQGALFHQWDYGDGQTGASSNPTHTFLTFGNYVTQLVGSNQWGCTDTATANIRVNPVPNASFTLPPVNTCLYPSTFQLINTSSGATGFQWNLGNGQTSSLFEPIVTYSQPDTFSIQLVASNIFGCTDTASQSVIMKPNVVANFQITPEVGCAPHKTDLIDLSVGANSWYWTFGDGDSSFAQNPIHIYQNPGIYNVTLIASNQAGCTDTLSLNNAVLVNPTPLAAFMSTPPERSFLTPVVDLMDLSTGGISAFYDMGNGQVNTLLNGQYIYPSPDTGTYIISQIVINQFGCTDTAFSTIRLFGETSLYVPTAFTPNDDGKNDVFRAYGFLVFEYELQIFNRWGELIFETDDIMEAWNGTKFNEGGPICKSEVYVWRIAYRDIDRVRHRIRGRVTLLNNGTE